MKNKFCTRLGIWLVLSLIGMVLHAQTTSLTVGVVKNGTGILTDLTAATHVLQANLPPTAVVSDLKLEYSEYDAKYYLTAKVSNDPITSVGIQLNTSGSSILALAGPGVEITCNGYKCDQCRLIISNFRPICKCFSPNPPADMRCDMSSKVMLSL